MKLLQPKVPSSIALLAPSIVFRFSFFVSLSIFSGSGHDNSLICLAAPFVFIPNHVLYRFLGQYSAYSDMGEWSFYA